LTPKTQFLLALCFAIILIAYLKFVNVFSNGRGDSIVIGASLAFVFLCYSVITLLQRFYNKIKKSKAKD
jgi:hypothetical protein